jgi:hydrogenase expression/formation protein HypE
MKDKIEKTPNFNLSCPIPTQQYPHIMAAHGGGGKLMHQLIQKMFVSTFRNPQLEVEHDGATFPVSNGRLAFSTDSYVISPLFFPGGDIGSLAVHGTVNDLAMCGAKPLYLSAGFILEESFPMETLWKIVQSMSNAAQRAKVHIVTGDTKVVEKGKGDGVFINTAGVGIIEHNRHIAPSEIRPDDEILLSGDIGRHGIAIMAVREGLEFESTIQSDSAPVANLVMQLLEANIEIHCMRDLTRGGLSSALIEIAEKANRQIHIEERSIPVTSEVQGACEILGFDPLYVANEGRFVAFVSPKNSKKALEIMRAHPLGKDASIIGKVTTERKPLVTMTGKIGTRRIIDMLSGEQLPRIC